MLFSVHIDTPTHHMHTHRHRHTLSMTEGASENQPAAYGLS